MTNRKFTRRDCLRFAVGGAVTLPFAQSVWGARAQAVLPQLPKSFDEIDHFDVTHRVRDGWQASIPEPTSSCEVAIVGGGISALTAAWRLADRKVMLLEKEGETGGNSRGREFEGCRYALGAFMNQGPMAPFEDFFRELNVPLVEVHGNQHAWAGNGRLVRDPLGQGLGRLPFARTEVKALEKATQLLASYAKPKEGIFFPRADNTESIRALDRNTMWAEYQRLGLGAQGKQFFDALISARVGDSGEMLSAWMGSYLLSSAVARNYTAPGGHAVFSEVLRSRIPASSVRTSFTVIRVAQQSSDKVWITGVRGGAGSEGQLETIEADTAIMGVPKFYCMHMVEGLRQARPNALTQYTYNAYLVAQVFLRERIDVPFETCAPNNFTRFIVAPDQLPGNARRDGGGLLTIYIPYPRVAGRAMLYAADVKALGEQIVRDIESVYPAARGKVEAVKLHRWGHPMLTTRPGMDDALEKVRESFGRVAFAHSDSFGVTGLYSAIWTGMDAEAEARAILMS
ncbi:MAG: hypothetical protein JWL63_1108 [Rhodocyclales bacterium]|nr:hypothetical protein [Rhodocyclales bacterium]